MSGRARGVLWLVRSLPEDITSGQLDPSRDCRCTIPLHDLESCWWGISWKIFRNTVPVPEHEDDYRMASRYLFSSTGAKLEAFARAYYFNSSDTFYEVI
ncbi:hypothetical protein FRB94_003468 [Tulasnella sp. JGI-2019a]|nr:hypothetical protein FRB93_000533 [Tulasnella sp. JGI-2019a]KAG9002941.1 hypothetical protein FRB94_003468 [Tulasnella sp. JGI-2019a]